MFVCKHIYLIFERIFEIKFSIESKNLNQKIINFEMTNRDVSVYEKLYA